MCGNVSSLSNYLRQFNIMDYLIILQPKTFHDAIKPLIYFNCYAGIGAFRQPNQTDKIYFFMKVYTVFIILINWTAIWILYTLLTSAFASHYDPTMDMMMRIALICANSFITVIAPFLAWLRRKGLRDCIRQMPILDNTFQDVLGAPNEYRKWYNRMIFQIIAILSVMIFMGICDTVPNLQNLMQMNNEMKIAYIHIIYVTHQPILVMLLLDVDFCTFLGYLRKKFDHLNDRLLRLIETPSVFHPGKRLFVIPKCVRKIPGSKAKNTETENLTNEKHYLLREIRKAHLELCKLSRKINLAFGVQNLLSAGVSFAMITGWLYTIYGELSSKTLTNDKLVEIIQSVIWIVLYTFKIWLVNHSCWSVCNEAERTGEVIYELVDSRVDKDLTREIQEFGIQMLQNPVHFDACGFFTLDYTFIQGVIGSVTTYLIILIQMSPVSQSPASNTALAYNYTGNSRN